MNPNISKRRACIGFALLCGSLTAGGALAAPSDSNVATVELRYSDSDLSRPEGVERLYRRIKVAAGQVCGQVDIRDLKRFAIYKECYGQAVDDAVAQVHSSMLTALHRHRTRRTSPG